MVWWWFGANMAGLRNIRNTNERRSDKRVLRAFKQFLCNQNFKNV